MSKAGFEFAPEKTGLTWVTFRINSFLQKMI
jgi:hypothetical protein